MAEASAARLIPLRNIAIWSFWTRTLNVGNGRGSAATAEHRQSGYRLRLVAQDLDGRAIV